MTMQVMTLTKQEGNVEPVQAVQLVALQVVGEACRSKR